MALDATLEMIEAEGGAMTAVVTFSGLLTLGTNLETANENVRIALDQGATNLVLDLQRVAYSDSAGLGMLVHTYGVVKRKGGELRLCGVGGRVMSMLKMTRADRLLKVDVDRASSLAALEITTLGTRNLDASRS